MGRGEGGEGRRDRSLLCDPGCDLQKPFIGEDDNSEKKQAILAGADGFSGAVQ